MSFYSHRETSKQTEKNHCKPLESEFTPLTGQISLSQVGQSIQRERAVFWTSANVHYFVAHIFNFIGVCLGVVVWERTPSASAHFTPAQTHRTWGVNLHLIDPYKYIPQEQFAYCDFVNVMASY